GRGSSSPKDNKQAGKIGLELRAPGTFGSRAVRRKDIPALASSGGTCECYHKVPPAWHSHSIDVANTTIERQPEPRSLADAPPLYDNRCALRLRAPTSKAGSPMVITLADNEREAAWRKEVRDFIEKEAPAALKAGSDD